MDGTPAASLCNGIPILNAVTWAGGTVQCAPFVAIPTCRLHITCSMYVHTYVKRKKVLYQKLGKNIFITVYKNQMQFHYMV